MVKFPSVCRGDEGLRRKILAKEKKPPPRITGRRSARGQTYMGAEAWPAPNPQRSREAKYRWGLSATRCSSGALRTYSSILSSSSRAAGCRVQLCRPVIQPGCIHSAVKYAGYWPGNTQEILRPLSARTTNVTTSNTRNTTNRNCAIPEAAPAIPPKPSSAAMIANTKNVSAQPIMITSVLCPTIQALVKTQRGWRASVPYMVPRLRHFFTGGIKCRQN